MAQHASEAHVVVISSLFLAPLLVCIYELSAGSLFQKVAYRAVISVCEEQRLNMIRKGDVHERVTERKTVGREDGVVKTYSALQWCRMKSFHQTFYSTCV